VDKLRRCRNKGSQASRDHARHVAPFAACCNCDHIIEVAIAQPEAALWMNAPSAFQMRDSDAAIVDNHGHIGQH